MHLHLLRTGQYFPVLPLTIQHWLWSPTILIGIDSPGNCRDHRSGWGSWGWFWPPRYCHCLNTFVTPLILNFLTILILYTVFFLSSLRPSTLQFSGGRLWLNRYLHLRCLCSMFIAQPSWEHYVNWFWSFTIFQTAWAIPVCPEWLCTARHLLCDSFTVTQNS